MFETLFEPYQNYTATDIALEITAILFGLISVFLAKKNHVGVYPTGLISTVLYVYLLWQWGLVGDMLINFYYSTMSIYGWILWSRKHDEKYDFPISKMNLSEIYKSIVIFLLTCGFVIVIYNLFNKFTNWTAYVDTFTTGIFFVGMWLMAKRKIENWILWIVGDFISIPLYYCKGYTLTGIQYLVFTIIAIYAYKEWKNYLPR